jgi:ring-1,2-phenylacetyl-CoA epoxidase subunit PaaB
MESNDQMELWEVFLQESDNAPHSHAGSVRGSDPENALQNARDVYARRGKVKNIWVVKSKDIVASRPDDIPSFFDQIPDKIYRHPQFYKTDVDDELWKKT